MDIINWCARSHWDIIFGGARTDSVDPHWLVLLARFKIFFASVWKNAKKHGLKTFTVAHSAVDRSKMNHKYVKLHTFVYVCVVRVSQALEKAKEAGRKERVLVRQREQSENADHINIDLTYSVSQASSRTTVFLNVCFEDKANNTACLWWDFTSLQLIKTAIKPCLF